MWLWTRQEAKQIDELSIKFGTPAETFMETAGQNMAHEILKRFSQRATRVCVLCGPGNNGGDAFVVARELFRAGMNVTVIDALVGGTASDLRTKKKLEFQGEVISSANFLRQFRESDVWIDGLFGIGLNRDLNSQDQALIQKINSVKGFKIALDTPSGLDVDNGNLYGACFCADLTLTVGQPKPGFYLNQGPENCGRIVRVSAGFPSEIAKARSVFLLSRKLVAKWIPTRSSTDNKTRGGRTLIWAGSSEMPGAAILAAEAASRVGSGYVYASEREVLKFRPEVIPWDGELEKISSVLIGPGLGVQNFSRKTFESLKTSGYPVVADADALTALAQQKMAPLPANWIVTPHAGELSRLIPLSAKEIESNRLAAARKAQELLGCTVVLKGLHTIVALSKISVIVPTGNVALAKGGSGDVLGGMIAGFLSQGLSSKRAAMLATYLHGKIADDWIRSQRDVLSLTPSDLIERLPQALYRLRDRN